MRLAVGAQHDGGIFGAVAERLAQGCASTRIPAAADTWHRWLLASVGRAEQLLEGRGPRCTGG